VDTDDPPLGGASPTTSRAEARAAGILEGGSCVLYGAKRAGAGRETGVLTSPGLHAFTAPGEYHDTGCHRTASTGLRTKTRPRKDGASRRRAGVHQHRLVRFAIRDD